MTEQEVREIFARNYNGKDLNEELMACLDEICLKITRQVMKAHGKQKEILETVVATQSRVRLFMDIKNLPIILVPMKYVQYIDQVRKTVVQVLPYLLENYDDTNAFFKQRFSEEELKNIIEDISQIISNDSAIGERNLRETEMRVYEELINFSIIAIFGTKLFNAYAKEFNEATVFLKQCQSEADTLNKFKLPDQANA